MLDKPENIRRFLLDAYAAGLAAVNPRNAVFAALSARPPVAESVHVLAVGKASVQMCAGALDALAAQGTPVKRALAITPYASESSPDNVECIQTIRAAHPIPDELSLAAGRRLRDELRTTDSELVILLVSGGASSLAEIPAEPLLDEELIEIHEELYRLGLDIRQWNAVRQRLSALKAGGLLEFLPAGVACRQLLVSDVPGDDPVVIASGPGVPLAEPPVLPELPHHLIDMLPPWKPRRAAAVDTEIVASNSMLLDAVEAFAVKHDVEVRQRAELKGDAGNMALDCVEVLCNGALCNGGSGLYLWGGETSLRLPRDPPPGGRNQHLALAAARAISGNEKLFLLAAGTDGIDGNTEEAGALVDAGSLRRGELDGLDAENCLAEFRSHEFLASSGDLLHTGPSGGNVMDVALGFRK